MIEAIGKALRELRDRRVEFAASIVLGLVGALRSSTSISGMRLVAVSNAGATTPLAGAFASSPRVDGVGTAAHIGSVDVLAASSDGRLYFVDFEVIRVLEGGNTVTTLAGSSSGATDGAGLAARCNQRSS